MPKLQASWVDFSKSNNLKKKKVIILAVDIFFTASEYAFEPLFRDKLVSGRYQYVDNPKFKKTINHFVLFF